MLLRLHARTREVLGRRAQREAEKGGTPEIMTAKPESQHHWKPSTAVGDRGHGSLPEGSLCIMRLIDELEAVLAAEKEETVSAELKAGRMPHAVALQSKSLDRGMAGQHRICARARS